MLAALGRAIASCPVEHKPRLAGYVLRLGRLLRDNPLASGALLEVTGHDAADESALSARISALQNEGRAHATRLATLLSRMTEPARLALFANTHISSGSQPRGFRELLRRIESGALTELGLADLDHFRQNLLPHLRESLASMEADDPAVGALFEEVEQLERTGTVAKQVRDADEILKRSSTQRVVQELSGFVNSFESTLARGMSEVAVNPDNFRDDLPFVIELLIAQLHDGVARRYAVHRLRVLFEHFLRDTLRSELHKEEKEAKPQRERILQRHMDEFLFREGYFPLTHSEASAGYTDTVLLDNAESTRIPPLLIELKQVVSISNPADVHPAKIRTAIGKARGEVQRYRGHLASRTPWRNIAPIILVVHSCRTDVATLEAPDVVLIDISDRTPSGKQGAT